MKIQLAVKGVIHLAWIVGIFMAGAAGAQTQPPLGQPTNQNSYSVTPAALTPHARYFPTYGFAGAVQLSDFAPLPASHALRLLMARKYQAADIAMTEAIRNIGVEGPALYVAREQIRPDEWTRQIPLLREAAARRPDPLTRFKLATLLLYDWGARSPSSIPDPMAAQLEEAQNTFADLWRQDRMPMAAVMLAEAAPLYPDNPELRECGNAWSVYDELIQYLGGAGVFASYVRARQRNWRSEPPPAELVPAANRRELVGIVCALLALNMRRSGMCKIVNRVAIPMPPDPYTSTQLAAQKYYKAWFDQLRSE